MSIRKRKSFSNLFDFLFPHFGICSKQPADKSRIHEGRQTRTQARVGARIPYRASISLNFQQANVVGELINTGVYLQSRLCVTGYTLEFWMGSVRFVSGKCESHIPIFKNKTRLHEIAVSREKSPGTTWLRFESILGASVTSLDARNKCAVKVKIVTDS